MSEFTRKCPSCNNEVKHTNINNCKQAEKNKRICRQCSYELKKINLVGSNNPFFGKKHTKKTKEKISKKQLQRDWSYTKTQSFKDNASKKTSGKNNPMYGRSVYDVWLEKYGKKEADKKLKAYKKLQSKNNSGSKNSMYGKPTPTGSGNGWKGWYKGVFFRSLRELSYMIHLDENNIVWTSAANIRVKYKHYNGNERTYQPDFVINNDTIIEIKPKKLHNSTLVQLKHKALENELGHKYNIELIDFPINIKDIQKNIDKNHITFMNNYLERFQTYVKKIMPN